MYITNDPAVAKIAEASGVDRIFIDMEYIGKGDRQGGMDTVQSHHTPADIARVKAAVSKAKLMVRVNPIHNATADYGSSKEEIDAAIEAGADILMLPYFKTPEEVAEFVRLVDGRAVTLPLVETPEAAERIHEILAVEGIDEIYVGLNDLSLGYGMNFMFRLLADGTVERLCNAFRDKGIPYGFGGIAAIGQGLLPAERVIAEHYRLGSECVILSRSFCNAAGKSIEEIQSVFEPGVAAIRDRETECGTMTAEGFEENRLAVVDAVDKICAIIAAKKA
jgi:hypothetical protein